MVPWRSWRSLACLALGVAFLPALSAAQPAQPFVPEEYVSSSDWGGIGLLQMRTARFGPDGLFNVGFSQVFPYKRFFINVHIFPRLEATFRYTEVTNLLYSGSPSFSGFQSLKDRGADLKFLLVGERDWIPAIAIGLQDSLGTGLFAGEYLVASKRYYDFDFHFGLGWGYPGSKGNIQNPMLILGDRFERRGGYTSGGGIPSYGTWLTGGTVGMFGGVEYRTPWEGLTLKLEYDGHDYSQEPRSNNQPSATPFNFGVNFRPYPWIDLALALERGNKAMLRVSLRTDFQNAGVTKFDPPPPPVAPRPQLADALPAPAVPPAAPFLAPLAAPGPGPAPAPQAADSAARLFDDLAALGMDVRAVEMNGDAVTLVVAAANPAAVLDHAAAARAVAARLGAGAVTVIDMGGGGGVYPGASPEPFPAQPAVALQRPDAAAGQASGAALVYSEQERLAIGEAMARGLAAEQIFLDSLRLDGRSAVVSVNGLRFRQVARDIGRAARVVINYLPAPIEELTIVSINGGMEVSRVTFRRTDIEDAARSEGSPDEVFVGAEIEAGQPGWPESGYALPKRYPNYLWSLAPVTRQHVGGPDQFLLYQIWLELQMSAEIRRGWVVTTAVGKNLWNNFDRIQLRSDSQLPHVRSDIKEYLQQGEDNIVRLQSDYFVKAFPDVYTRISAGILEEMYGGISVEFLYRPFESRVALGLEVNEVRQRTFDQRFSFQDYQVSTGHLSLYYDTPYHDVLVAVHAGQYLAGDRGATFEISRRFDSGVRVGAWATMTNVPFAVFGEGSFDKGFFIVMPLELFFTTSTLLSGTFAFRPLFRDGGQRLNLLNRLYDLTSEGNLGEVTRDWPRLFQ